ncbi:FKBP-type peptidyl-prolyl cis-trans isomerase [Catellatospora sp. KI3]|uniref:FKBP-type peptidyl-prolyl cis-trans isomerase n=1 Tax=Catellatospora sp. KI3 TaxID=3041620 RepID=UPI00248283B8|nr:FKBP-type peptidyl-prolyl cis-trans isomerase [Catellatospora sp. KI3]MDI1464508.1 FKBP-type peptidyl-prolyl cis-trans isomerase [Catellatospora sp. KI3]
MSEQVQEKHVGPSAARRATKAQRREERMVQAKAAARRKRILSVVGLFVAVLALIGFAYLVFPTRGTDDGSLTSTADGTTQSTGAQPDPAQQPAGEFPPVPAGADPALKTKPAITKGDQAALTKLGVTMLVEGKGAVVKAGDSITVNYVGATYKDGKEFQATWDMKQAFTTVIGNGQVIPGWDQGLVGVKVGSRVQLDIPSEMAYGDNGQIPGPLRFIVDVLKIG